MESNNEFNISVILATASICFSLLSVFLMYYIFAGVALVTGIVSMHDERAKKVSIASILFVCITFIVKMIVILIQNGNLPEWLMQGIL